jgi:2-polyprenyl-3-methyl-5-hydroxy-6-metoxy-1,4-benzoquinol methylase
LAFVYDTTVDPEAENNTHAYLLSMVGYNKSVLELGCATGYLSRAMAERGCSVVGIELDAEAAAVAEKWAERVIVGDIDRGEVWGDVADASFDVVLCGDVLEHLRDPLSALRSAVHKLKPSGIVVTSLPNIAHGDVRLALLAGSFRYRDVGLLDRTHLRFFTLESVRELLRDAGLLPVETRRIVVPLFHSELDVERADVPQPVIDAILTDPEAESYQFVMKSVRDDGAQVVADLTNRINELADHVHHEQVRETLLRREVAEATQRHDQMAAENAALVQERASLIDQVTSLHRHIGALDGHVAGLDQIIARLNQGLAESAQRAGTTPPGARPQPLATVARRAYRAARRAFTRAGPDGR